MTAIRLVGSRYRVEGSGSRDIFSFDADAAVLTTGHSRTELPPDQGRLATIADRQPGLRYISGDSAADLDLDNIPSQSSVGIIGLGLSFYDILMSFTVGRGGQFKQTVAGMFSYIPSGRELSSMYWNGLRPGDVHLNVSAPGWAKYPWSSLFGPWNAEATGTASPR
ncbi:MAG: hypothetical protein ACRDU4_20675 [Mycobacterium sp.]